MFQNQSNKPGFTVPCNSNKIDNSFLCIRNCSMHFAWINLLNTTIGPIWTYEETKAQKDKSHHQIQLVVKLEYQILWL